MVIFNLPDFPPQNKWDKYLVLFYTGLTLTVVLKEIQLTLN